MSSSAKRLTLNFINTAFTIYALVSPEDEHIKMFWEVLRSFEEEELSTFLRFVWARSTLPRSSQEFHQKFKIQVI